MSPTTDTLPITIDVLLGPDEWNAGLRSDAFAGLTATPKTLTPTWLYDDTESALCDASRDCPSTTRLARNSRSSTAGLRRWLRSPDPTHSSNSILVHPTRRGRCSTRWR